MGGPWVSGGPELGALVGSLDLQGGGASGALRGLNPPHRVKSISMTTFTEPEVLFLQARGNEACRKVWLGSFDPRTSLLPDSRDPQKVKEFLQEKYEKKRWYVSPDQAKGAASLASQSSTPEVKPQQTLLGDSGGLLTAAGSSRTSGQPRLPHQRTPQPAKKASTDLLADIGGDPFAAPQPAPAFAMFPAFPGKPGPKPMLAFAILMPVGAAHVTGSVAPSGGSSVTAFGASPVQPRPGSGIPDMGGAPSRFRTVGNQPLRDLSRAGGRVPPGPPGAAPTALPAKPLRPPAPRLPGPPALTAFQPKRTLHQTGSLSSSPSSSSIQHPTPFLCTGARTAALGREGVQRCLAWAPGGAGAALWPLPRDGCSGARGSWRLQAAPTAPTPRGRACTFAGVTTLFPSVSAGGAQVSGFGASPSSHPGSGIPDMGGAPSSLFGSLSQPAALPPPSPAPAYGAYANPFAPPAAPPARPSTNPFQPNGTAPDGSSILALRHQASSHQPLLIARCRTAALGRKCPSHPAGGRPLQPHTPPHRLPAAQPQRCGDGLDQVL
nr:LOW QUALITY PROTEIN: arf-GAP domain and FG repeat-containing protein 2 [Chelonoidis abingdonii]